MLPKYKEIQKPLVQEIYKRGGKSRPSERYNGKTIYQALADDLELSITDLDEEVQEASGPRSKWENMVRWARNELRKMGIISNTVRGLWALTPKGLKYAETL